MTTTAQLDHMRRLVKCLEADRTDMAEGMSTVPIENYRSQARFEAEREKIFRQLPVIVAASSEIANPGDSFATERLGASVIVARDADGKVHGLLNACRHRNTRLVDGERVECRRAFKCPYHNWVYGLDGALKAVPQEFGFPGMERETMGLVPVPVVEKHGLVWMIPNPEATLDLDAHLAGLGDDLDACGFGEAIFFRRKRQHRKANWKLIADAFLEAYHIQRLHRETVAAYFTDNNFLCDRIGRHVRAAIGRKATAEVLGQPVETWQVGHHMTFSYNIFPCTVLVKQPDFLTLLSFVPVAVDETEIDHMMLLPHAPRTDEEREHYERAFTFMDAGVFNGEDIWVAEQGQSVIHSGANEVMTFGAFEHNVKFFHDCIDEMVG